MSHCSLQKVWFCTMQAYVHKHRAGRNARWFAPEGMRELGPSEKVSYGRALQY